MVEYSSLYNNIYNENCVTGDSDHLYARLKESISKAKRIDIIVAFLMETGVRLLEDDFKEAVDKGATLRILCGNYLNITQPQALYLIKDSLGDKVDLRFYNVSNKSFHPKAYIFEYENKSEIFIGSSNVSRSALTSGIEWNYRLCSGKSPEDYAHFRKTFEELFLNHSIIVDDVEMRRYSKNWRRPKLFEDLRPGMSIGFFSGDQKDKECDILFATVQTLGRKEYLNDENFARDATDYIVIDEFHHAVAESYKNIIKYFRPKFLLGLTATPERLEKLLDE